jgi:superfamily II RNA helicase
VLIDHLPDGGQDAADTVAEDALYGFTDWAEQEGFSLYRHQEDALVALAAGEHVILGTPTGSGKSLAAAGALALALAAGRRGVYTAPIKALVSEKFFELIDLFGPERVGLATGDATVNPEAPVICCTAEVLANRALREGAATPFATVVMDEFHFYSDPDRGWAWQVPLLTMPTAQFLLMSATLGNVDFFVRDLERRTGRRATPITDAPRPVPLTFAYEVTRLPQLITGLVKDGLTPAYVVQFTQREAVELAGLMGALPLAGKEQQAALRDGIGDFRFGAGFGATLSKLLRKGIGLHHAGMLPRYRRLVEKLAGEGLLSVISGTDTLGVGINMPIKTVVLTSLVKFDGRRQRRLGAREFHQIAGRAGRAGFDTEGHVVVQAPEHEIDRAWANAKAIRDEAAGRKPKSPRGSPQGGSGGVGGRRPGGQGGAADGIGQREKSKVSWSKETFEKLVAAAPEPLASRMRVTHAMVLELFSRADDPVGAAWRLLTDNHEPRRPRNPLVRDACRIYHSLKVAGVVTHTPGRVALAVELPDDFTLSQPLALFGLAACDLLDPASPDYALDVVSVFEATLEPPVAILIAQEKAAKTEALARMKAEGMDYLERMNALDDVTYPRPLAEFLEAALTLYSRGRPWVAPHELTPKSIVREMRERAQTFNEFVSRYGLARSEGVLLRYLTDAYHALARTAPPAARSQLADTVEWLAQTIREVDSSLLDEWQNLVEIAQLAGPRSSSQAAAGGQEPSQL